MHRLHLVLLQNTPRRGCVFASDAKEGAVVNLDDLKKTLAADAGLMPLDAAWAKGLCVDCRQPAEPKCHTAAGHGEYRISGMCEECFDALFADDDEE